MSTLHALYRRFAGALPPAVLRIRAGPLAGRRLAVQRSLKRPAYAAGDYEPATAGALCARAHPGMVAFDVGAHFGYFTLLLAGRVAQVHAFEPAPANFKALIHTLRLNHVANAEAHCLAISAHDATAALEITPASSMYRLRGNRRELLEGHVPALGALPVRTASLDRFVPAHGIARVDLVKLDVEGEELNALLGMQEIMRRWRPALVIEVHTQLNGGEHPNQILYLLRRRGYTCRDLDAGGTVITQFAHTWSEHHVLAE
ncbi:MAG: FkbM family methyltransferase [Anaerolineae bacterium]|nr:FkbM family methyltransferase [Anaerolineae bacterium]